jgi:glutathione S-transferase
MAWFASTVHPSFTHINRPERFADDPACHANLRETGRRSFWTNLQEIDALLKGKDWMMGPQYTVCDCYAIIFYGWGARINLPMKELTSYTAFKDRMLARPAVRTILERENNILLTAGAG